MSRMVLPAKKLFAGADAEADPEAPLDVEALPPAAAGAEADAEPEADPEDDADPDADADPEAAVCPVLDAGGAELVPQAASSKAAANPVPAARRILIDFAPKMKNSGATREAADGPHGAPRAGAN